MFNLMDAETPALGAIYCVVMVIIGSFLLMNLILAVIVSAFINV